MSPAEETTGARGSEKGVADVPKTSNGDRPETLSTALRDRGAIALENGAVAQGSLRATETSSDRRLSRLIAPILIVILVLAVLGGWLYARGGGPVPGWFPFASAAFDPLAPSDAEESVLRAVRLSGIEHAVVGEQRGTAVLRLDIPEVSSAADVEIAWQMGVASLSSAYPQSREYVVQLFENQSGLLEVQWAGSDARDAVSADDAEALRFAATFVYLSEEGGDE